METVRITRFVKRQGSMGQIWGFLKLIAAAFCGAGILLIVVSYDAFNLPDASADAPLASLNVSYTDFVTIMLTCVTVVLAAVGIGVGVVAAYTITNLKEDARAGVDEAVETRMKDVKKKLAKMEASMEEKVTALAYGVGRNLDDDADEDMEVR